VKDRSEKPVSIEVKQAAERIRVEAQSSKDGSGERRRKARLRASQHQWEVRELQ